MRTARGDVASANSGSSQVAGLGREPGRWHQGPHSAAMPLALEGVLAKPHRLGSLSMCTVSLPPGEVQRDPFLCQGHSEVKGQRVDFNHRVFDPKDRAPLGTTLGRCRQGSANRAQAVKGAVPAEGSRLQGDGRESRV